MYYKAQYNMWLKGPPQLVTGSRQVCEESSNSQKTWLSTKGFYQCGHNVCKVCHFAQVTKTFSPTSYEALRPHTIKRYINCDSKFIIYLVTCTPCKLQYVGCTSNPLKVRIRRHLSDVANSTVYSISAVSKYF